MSSAVLRSEPSVLAIQNHVSTKAVCVLYFLACVLYFSSWTISYVYICDWTFKN